MAVVVAVAMPLVAVPVLVPVPGLAPELAPGLAVGVGLVTGAVPVGVAVGTTDEEPDGLGVEAGGDTRGVLLGLAVPAVGLAAGLQVARGPGAGTPP